MAGRSIVLVLASPLALALTYRFLNDGNRSDLVWLTLLAIATVGLGNMALYLTPAVIGCSWLAYLTIQLFEHEEHEHGWKHIRRGLFLIIPLIYPIRILVSLLVNIIPEPFDIRNVVLMIAVPLVVIRRKTGLFLFFYGALSIAPISEQAGWKIPARISAGEREYGFCLGRRQIYRRQ